MGAVYTSHQQELSKHPGPHFSLAEEFSQGVLARDRRQRILCHGVESKTTCTQEKNLLVATLQISRKTNISSSSLENLSLSLDPVGVNLLKDPLLRFPIKPSAAFNPVQETPQGTPR